MMASMQRKSHLDGELALIAHLARRGLAAPCPEELNPQQRSQRKVRVLESDAVWPTLNGYPYGKVA